MKNYTTYAVRVYKDGMIEFRKKGKLHRLDGPAIEDAYGNKFWFQNNLLHREDGPAIVFKNGEKQWYKNDKLHRLDGPAIEYACGRKGWYIDGFFYTEKSFNAEIKKRNKSLTKDSCDGKVIEVEGKKYKLVAE